MQYSLTAIVSLSLIVAVAFTSHDIKAVAPAAQPATQPVRIPLNILPDTIEQLVFSDDSHVERTWTDGKNGRPLPPDKIIPIVPPQEFRDWIKQRTGEDSFESCRIELLSLDSSLLFRLNGVVKWNIDGRSGSVRLLRSSNNDNFDPSAREKKWSGTIEVNAGEDQRICLDFDATVSLSDRKQRDSRWRIPPSAKITWKKPECWKKDE